MIARLRARHLRVVFAAAVLAALGMAGALAVRRPPSTVADLPGPLRAASAPAAARVLWERADAWSGRALRTRVLQDGDRRLVELLQPTADPGVGAPDVLLYAAHGPVPGPFPGARLPGDAVLLGAFPGDVARSYSLPPDLADGGWLVLYSLARREVLDRARLPAASDAPAAGPVGDAVDGAR